MFQEKLLNKDTEATRLFALLEELYPICRSITGDGVRKTLRILQEYVPLDIHELPTGTEVFDWTIPKEWNIQEAWIKNSNGDKLIDFRRSNLHVLNYSIPVDKVMALSELKEHLHTLPDQPDLIPHKTSYFKEQWGFCLTHNQFIDLEEGNYHVFIDSTLEDGHMTYGELLIKGTTSDEVLISTHVCHPSLCNDNLSGISVAVHLAQYLLKKQDLRYSYRFLFIPATIGSIAWLAQNEKNVDDIKHGLVLSCLGDRGDTMTYKRSRKGNASIDKLVEQMLDDSDQAYEIREFLPYGYDERQFCSPGFVLPVGLFMRTPFGEFPEYHTSADNLNFIDAEALGESLSMLKKVVYRIEHNRSYQNLKPKGEPNLGKRGLYKLIGGKTDVEISQMAILWVLNLSDGKHSLLDIARRSGITFQAIKQAADALEHANLLKLLS